MWFRKASSLAASKRSGTTEGAYSVRRLSELDAQLLKHARELSAGRGDQTALVEVVRAIAEVIVYGDQHKEQLFEYFCEKNMFPVLLGLLDEEKCGTALKVQIIQSVSILVQNIRSETSLYYTLSNNLVNRMIQHPFDFGNEEILAHYISFLKTLSLRLNSKTVQFFFNDQLNTFPLYEEAIKFFDHPEGMARTAVRTITLNVFRVHDERMQRYLQQGPSGEYIEKVLRYIHRRCRRLHLLLVRASMPEMDPRISLKLENALTDQLDYILYLEDILMLRIDGLSEVIVDSGLAYLYLPLLMASLMPMTFPFNEVNDLEDGDFDFAGIRKEDLVDVDLSTSSGSLLSLFLLAQSFFAFKDSTMANQLVKAMFVPRPKIVMTKNTNISQEDDKLEREGEKGDEEDEDEQLSDETDGASSLFGNRNGAASNADTEESGNQIGCEFLRFLQHQDERHCLSAACMLYALIHNESVKTELLQDTGLRPGNKEEGYAEHIVSALLSVLRRNPPVTTLCQRVFAKLLIDIIGESRLKKEHIDIMDEAYMVSTRNLRSQLASFEGHDDRRFLEIFESEWNVLCKGPLKVEFLMTRPDVLLPSHPSLPLDSRRPYMGIEATKCAVRSFMILRLLWVTLHGRQNSLLAAVASTGHSKRENQHIDFRNSDFIHVKVLSARGAAAAMQKAVITMAGGALILVEPERSLSAHAECGTSRSVCPLQHVRFAMAPDDPLIMYIAVRSPSDQPIGWAHKELKSLRADPETPEATKTFDLGGKKLETTLFPWEDANSPENSANSTGSTWYITMRFEDYGSAFWAQEQLQRAINATLNSKMKKLRKLVQ